MLLLDFKCWWSENVLTDCTCFVVGGQLLYKSTIFLLCWRILLFQSGRQISVLQQVKLEHTQFCTKLDEQTYGSLRHVSLWVCPSDPSVWLVVPLYASHSLGMHLSYISARVVHFCRSPLLLVLEHTSAMVVPQFCVGYLSATVVCAKARIPPPNTSTRYCPPTPYIPSLRPEHRTAHLPPNFSPASTAPTSTCQWWPNTRAK